MCDIVMGNKLPIYDEDPFVVVSLYHNEVERDTLDIATIMSRFIEGQSTSVWGPIAWSILHKLSRSPGFRDVERLLKCWQNVLPCPECRHHLREHVCRTQFNFSTMEETHQYTIMLHNAVNMQLGKKMFIQ